ncbi:MAG: SprT-like domain-containing protein [Prevotellaceae bacterium]|nr:SprT-like domain-containing protein [Prevotellaceae bacterium]
MQIDTLWMKTNFMRFNTQYFDGVLPLPRLRAGRSRTQLGTMSCKRKTSWGRTKLYDFTISLSNYYDQTEHQFQSVLLHEMIHLSIAVSGVKDTSPHGVVFRGLMQRLNRDGWDIQIMTKMHDYTKAYTGSATVIAQYIVLALEMNDGKRFLSSVNPKFVRDINRQLKMVPQISHFAWFTTSDRWFETMPKVRSLRGRRVTAEVFQAKTQTMKPINV